ncbi:MAG: ArsR family transcriptional regulator [Haliscomenobacter sp.]|nr:ArsR family transcriptional regulator [Haliscomenobacter sp.]MBK9492257.1 ArsR family transcriptional regulator [Haliscomenobacter sp.]
MIEILISSKTRIKLLMKFFLNSDATAYLRSLESEFGESSNAIRLELNRFEEAGMLVSRLDGNKKIFQANTEHPLFKEVHNILLKQIGLDRVIENVIERLGEVSKVYVIGEFSKGLDSQVIDLVFIGNIEINYLVHLIEKVETLIKRKIRYLIYSEEEFENLKSWGLTRPRPLLLWAKD